MNYYCPYCYKDAPKGYEPSTWACCGEVGHAVACNYDDNEGRCTADTSKDDNGDMCPRCIKNWQEEYRHYYGLWKAEKAMGLLDGPEKKESIVGLTEDMHG